MDVSLDRLNGYKPPTEGQVRDKEAPWHRQAARLLATGKIPFKQVAAACNVTPNSISMLMRNEWFQQVILKYQEEYGVAQDIMEMFKAECMPSLATLVEIRDDVASPASVRRASAMDILTQVLGKPTQKVEVESSVRSDDPVAEFDRLTRENASLATQTGFTLDPVSEQQR